MEINQVITKFAGEYRLKTEKRFMGEGEPPEIFIPGSRYGRGTEPGKRNECHIYEYSVTDGILGVCFIRDWKTLPPTQLWEKYKNLASRMGFRTVQDGKYEGCLTFDPKNQEQARLAMRIAGVRPRRKLSPEHRARLLKINEKTRFRPKA